MAISPAILNRPKKKGAGRGRPSKEQNVTDRIGILFVAVVFSYVSSAPRASQPLSAAPK